ncbi:uncharacterized protein LOC120251308 [Dioscorea cayenensis subsp. rotundata]|uniref:Uncharacterized protein LOC120251308 n=1 Tax=Dioscorea cayennensis subsp. rotundata TaxID=55577 RepID=A0AB40ALI2_DIOCR|nr:uncharacterized protein LOC120251308 [Dioscorea cayenensis subsp. rotundata]
MLKKWDIVDIVLEPVLHTPPENKLKELPAHLEYAFLKEDYRMSVIISCILEASQKKKLVDMLSGHKYYCFFDAMFGYLQILVDPEDQEKTTFTCPYDFMDVFMDDFSVLEESFEGCMKNLMRILSRCGETNLVLNWEKCHFMVKEGIELDKAKLDTIEKLPPI